MPDAAEADRESAPTHGVGRLCLVVTAVFTGFQIGRPNHLMLTALVLTILCAAAVAAVVAPSRLPFATAALRSTLVTQILVTCCLLSPVTVIAQMRIAGSVSLSVCVALVVLLAAVLAVWLPEGGLGAGSFITLSAAWTAVMIILLQRPKDEDDFLLFLREATDDLAHGRFPYGGSLPNPYSAKDTALYWSPELIDHHRILVGFPYLPASLVTDLPAALLGDPRLAHVVAVIGATWLLRSTAVDAGGRAAAVLLLASPLTITLVYGGWIEPVIILGVAGLATALVRGSRAGSVAAIALLLASKQYFVSLVPFLIPVGRRLGSGVAIAGGAAAASLCTFFFVWGPGEFWHDVVVTHLLQPYRADSISLMVAIGNRFGQPPAWVLAVAPLAAGLAVSTWVSVRGRPGATTSCAALGLGLFATVLLSKQAHLNYYALIQAALVAATVTWPVDGPAAEHEDV